MKITTNEFWLKFKYLYLLKEILDVGLNFFLSPYLYVFKNLSKFIFILKEKNQQMTPLMKKKGKEIISDDVNNTLIFCSATYIYNPLN